MLTYAHHHSSPPHHPPPPPYFYHSPRPHIHTTLPLPLQAMITDMHGRNRYIDARTCAGLTPLHMAAWAGHVEVAKILLANGAYLNPKIVFSSPSTSSVLPGSTPTHLATRKNRIHVVKALLSAYVRPPPRPPPAPLTFSPRLLCIPMASVRSPDPTAALLCLSWTRGRVL